MAGGQPDGGPAVRGAGVRAPRRHPAPRHQAREHPALRLRRGPAHRLRHRPHRGRLRDGDRRVHRIALLQRARGAQRAPADPPVGHLRSRRRLVLDHRGPRRLRAARGRGNHRPVPADHRPAHSRPARPRRPRRALRGARARHGQGPRQPSGQRGGVRARAAGGAARRGDPGRRDGAAGGAAADGPGCHGGRAGRRPLATTHLEPASPGRAAVGGHTGRGHSGHGPEPAAALHLEHVSEFVGAGAGLHRAARRAHCRHGGALGRCGRRSHGRRRQAGRHRVAFAQRPRTPAGRHRSRALRPHRRLRSDRGPPRPPRARRAGRILRAADSAPAAHAPALLAAAGWTSSPSSADRPRRGRCAAGVARGRGCAGLRQVEHRHQRGAAAGHRRRARQRLAQPASGPDPAPAGRDDRRRRHRLGDRRHHPGRRVEPRRGLRLGHRHLEDRHPAPGRALARDGRHVPRRGHRARRLASAGQQPHGGELEQGLRPARRRLGRAASDAVAARGGRRGGRRRPDHRQRRPGRRQAQPHHRGVRRHEVEAGRRPADTARTPGHGHRRHLRVRRGRARPVVGQEQLRAGALRPEDRLVGRARGDARPARRSRRSGGRRAAGRRGRRGADVGRQQRLRLRHRGQHVDGAAPDAHRAARAHRGRGRQDALRDRRRHPAQPHGVDGCGRGAADAAAAARSPRRCGGR